MKITVHPRDGWCGLRACARRGGRGVGGPGRVSGLRLGREASGAPWGAGRAPVCPGNKSYPQSTVTDANLETNTYQQTSKGIPGKAGERQGA